MKRNLRTQIVAVIVAEVLALSACNPAPKYARPPAPTPTVFKETAPADFKEGAGWKLAEPADDRIPGDWWELFNDPELSALEQQVRISNQTIAEAEANFRAAQALVAYARSSLFPRLTTSPTYSRSHASRTTRGVTVLAGGTGTTGAASSGNNTGFNGTGTGTTNGTNGTTGGPSSGTTGGSGVGATASSGILNNFSLPFTLSYEVDLWHRIRNTIAANTFAAQVSAADVAAATLSTEVQLAQDYFQLRELDAQRSIFTETVNNYRDSLRLTESRFRGGIASEEDVTQARTQLDTAVAQLTDLGIARATFEHAIATLTGRPPAALSIPVAPFRAGPPFRAVGAASRYSRRRT